MDAYNNAVDKIGDAIIDWSDPDGTFRADREVSKAPSKKKLSWIFWSAAFWRQYCIVILIFIT